MANVYWCSSSPIHSSLRFYEPVKAISLFPPQSLIFKCPAFKDYHKNLYALKFPLDYEVDIMPDGTLSTADYIPEFNNSMWECRDPKTRLYSIRPYTTFIAEKPLEIELFSASTVDDSFNNDNFIVPGRFDIGKWIRPIECAFYAKSHVKKIKIEDGNPFAFIRFLTDEKVTFKQFHANPDIVNLLEQINQARIKTRTIGRPLSFFYDMLARTRYKSYLLKLIKENLL
jgi:hypothetical protein